MGRIEKSEAFFLFKKDKIYFRSKKFWFKFLRVNSILSFKAYCKIDSNNNVEIIGKLPIIIVIQQIIFIVIMLSIISRFDSLLIEISFIIFILFILILNTIIFLSIERERFDKCYKELLEILRPYK